MSQVGRRLFLIATGALVVAPLAASAQHAARVPKIGYLSWAGPVLDKELINALRQGLREHGYVEGQSVVIEFRRGTTAQLPDLAAELVRLKVDVIVTVGSPGVLAAKKATSDIPVVMTLVADPLAAGVVPSLAHPGGNITGLSMYAPAVFGKALALLKEAVPRVSRVALLMDPTNPGHLASKPDVDAAAKVLGIEVQRIDVRNSVDLEAAYPAIQSRHADALYVFPLRLSAADAQKIERFAATNRLPVLMTDKERVLEGGLMSYGVDFRDEVRRAGRYIDRILKGAKPSDLPIEQPTKFQLVINRKTAKALNLTIPRSVFLQADIVIE